MENLETHPLRPAHRRHRISLNRQITQAGHLDRQKKTNTNGIHRKAAQVAMGVLTYLAGAGAPQVDAGAQSHTEHIQRRPVHQVEVEIVLELRSIQHFERNFRYFACGFPWWPQKFLTVKQNTEKLKWDIAQQRS